MRVNVKGDIGEKTTCAVGILFIILATGTTGSSTTTSTSTGTTIPLTATRKCIGTNSPTSTFQACNCVFRPKLCSRKWRVFDLVFSRCRRISHFFTNGIEW